jgi:CheY-like chemotaxis protein
MRASIMQASSGQRPVRILLVEDNPGDVRLTREALKETRIFTDLHVVSDGVEALDFLRRRGPFQNAPRPDIILLDLNLPRRSGREVLVDVKSDPELRRIPVMILSTSQAEMDVQFSYDHHANCYIRKPMEFEHFFEIVQAIERFWCSVVSLPERSGYSAGAASTAI